MEGEADIDTNILVFNISVKSIFTIYIFVFISVFIRGVTVHLFVLNHFGTGLSNEYRIFLLIFLWAF